MDVAICQHVKIGGDRCGSPALRDEHYCYFHAGAHRAIPSVNLWPRLRRVTSRAGSLSFSAQDKLRHRGHGISYCESLCDDASRLAFVDRRGEGPYGTQDVAWGTELPDEAAAIQWGFTRLIWGITQGLLNVRQAKLILSALHKAAADERARTATGDSAVASNELPFAIDRNFAVSGIRGD